VDLLIKSKKIQVNFYFCPWNRISLTFIWSHWT